HVDRESAIAFERIDGAVAKEIASDKTAHTVGDQIDLKRRIPIVATNLFDKRIEALGGRDIVLPPVICKYVIPPHPGIGGHAKFPRDEAPGLAQGAQD